MRRRAAAAVAALIVLLGSASPAVAGDATADLLTRPVGPPVPAWSYAGVALVVVLLLARFFGGGRR